MIGDVVRPIFDKQFFDGAVISFRRKSLSSDGSCRRQQTLHRITKGCAEGFNQGFTRVVKVANGFPGVLKAPKYEVGAVNKCPVKVK